MRLRSARVTASVWSATLNLDRVFLALDLTAVGAGFVRGTLGRQGDEKETTLSQFALDAYLTTQLFDDVEHDRQAQPVSRITDAADLAEWRDTVC